MRNHFNKKMEVLEVDILKMSSMVEESLIFATNSLKNRDVELAKKVIDNDELIDEKEIEIEDECLRLIALQQPLARDLRIIATALKIITDLERIADYSSDIAKITLKVANEEYFKALIHIPKMAEIAAEMVRISIDAYVSSDIEYEQLSYENLCDKIDELHKEIFNELISIMASDSSKINQATNFLLVSRYLERIGDHVTNICERIVFSETGERIDLNN